eukprot:TRINITY_DN99_c7_g1_i1.p3 TRINITY_DN99_c7_g1~~TRINITY_DN99_c7_g1_i1.p3  ORF type:complete len:226 (-),score=30.16 TRINITY_DN99_c7_g1_i1:435-1112(-)
MIYCCQSKQNLNIQCCSTQSSLHNVKRRNLIQGGFLQLGLFSLSQHKALAEGLNYQALEQWIQKDDLFLAQVRPLRAKPPPEIPVSVKVQRILELSKEARSAADSEDFQKALEIYTSITKEYPDLALTQYSKINQGLMLYELGKVKDALRVLESTEREMTGYPEVHAALAVILYNDVPDQVEKAEQQWEIANEFDKRYGDVSWVGKNKHWPPKMLTALNKFLQLG